MAFPVLYLSGDLMGCEVRLFGQPRAREILS
jgi:hypothetical protein